VKRGGGVQTLGGVSTYVGNTVIEGGMLRIDSATALSSASNIRLDGGVLGLGAGHYSANLGTGAGEIRFTGDGGFAGHGGLRTVTLNGGEELVWGSTSGFLGEGNKLILSYTGTAAMVNNTVEFTNAIDFGSGMRTVQVGNGTGAVDARLSGVLSGAGGLNKTDAGALELTAANTYTGGTVVSGGALYLLGSDGSIKGDVTLGEGAVLQLTGSAAANHADRLEDTARVTMRGGRFNFSHGAGAADYGETIGELVLEKGNNTIATSQAASGQTSLLSIGSLSRSAGATVNFSADTLGTRNNIDIASAPALDDGIIGAWATVGAVPEFATYGDNGVVAYAGHDINLDETNWAATSNVKLDTASGTLRELTANRVINSLHLTGSASGSGQSVDLMGHELRLAGGGFIGTGGDSSRINEIRNGTLTAGNAVNENAELIATVQNRYTYIGADIVDNGTGEVSLVKTGSGTLVLTGNNTYGGTTLVNEGILQVGDYGTTGTLGAGDVTLAGASSLLINRTTDLALSNDIGGQGSLIKYGGGTLTLTGNNTYTGTTTVTVGGVLEVGNGGTGGTLGSGNVTITSANLRFNRSDDFSVNNTIGGSGSITKEGAGILSLGGLSSYTGGTQINAGTLSVLHDAALGTGTVSIAAGASLHLGSGVAINNNLLLATGANVQRSLEGGQQYRLGTNGSVISQGNGDIASIVTSQNASSATSLSYGFTTASAEGALNDGNRVSDVFSLSGTGDDIFVLQLQVASGLTADSLLGWFSEDQWVNAIDGNTFLGTLAGGYQGYLGSFADAGISATGDYLGAYGVSFNELTGAGSVWAVLNHNSEFAVVAAVPEPSAFVFIGLGVAACFFRRRRK